MSELTDPNLQSDKRDYFEIIKVEKKLFKCPYLNCKRLFKEKGNLRIHKRIHTGERPYKCTYENCGKSFITHANLNSHISRHTGEKPYSCPHQGCGKVYSKLCRLRIHQRTHSGDKPFKCPYKNCLKSFNEKGNLKTHFRIHTGEKPYLCNFSGCSNSFKALGHLKDHIKRHYNIKPYICKECNASFARSSTLKIHMHIHTGEKPHKCPYDNCGKRFSEKGNMKTHLNTHRNQGVNLNENLFNIKAELMQDSLNNLKDSDFKLNRNKTKRERSLKKYFKEKQLSSKNDKFINRNSIKILKNNSEELIKIHNNNKGSFNQNLFICDKSNSNLMGLISHLNISQRKIIFLPKIENTNQTMNYNSDLNNKKIFINSSNHNTIKNINDFYKNIKNSTKEKSREFNLSTNCVSSSKFIDKCSENLEEKYTKMESSNLIDDYTPECWVKDYNSENFFNAYYDNSKENISDYLNSTFQVFTGVDGSLNNDLKLNDLQNHFQSTNDNISFTDFLNGSIN